MATTTIAKTTEPPASTASEVPPLENGDRLTLAEFECRYDAMPGLKKAELIDGVVYMPSPVSITRHGAPHCDLITWVGTYRAATPGILAGDNSSIRIDPKSMPQPDLLLFILPSYGGQARISPDDYVEGAPDLVAEVASSSASYDLHDKLQVYRRNGVREYIVWKVREGAIDWFILRDGQFERLPLGPDGLYRSESFPGLWLDPAAMVRGDFSAVLEAVQRGVASPEHAAFVARLEQQAGRPST